MVIRFLLRYRRLFIVALHLAAVALSSYVALWLRFDGAVPDYAVTLYVVLLPLSLVVRGVAFVPFRMYEGLWRYTGIWELTNIIGGVAISTIVFYGIVRFGFGITLYPRSVYLMEALLLVLILGGLRLGRRIYREIGHLEREKRVLIFGAGDAGEMVVRDMRNNPFYDYEPVGFVDDDLTKVGQRIHGVPVLGSRQTLPAIIKAANPHEILVAIPSSEARTIREVVRSLEPFKVPIKTLPNLRDVLDGRVGVGAIRDLAPEDLLARAPLGLDPEPVRALVAGKRVLVTGGGGSIGSELCLQIARLEPASLTILERYENGLYAICTQLADRTRVTVYPVIGDVADAARVNAVMAEHRPQIVFHAAAHKHVPLMEDNPCEAVKNNVTGTRVLAEAARRHEVDRFVLISTDKAVNPTSVMGATKRVAELLLLGMATTGATSFLAVRFGNVLASSGSVIPRFLDQIRAGGPVTVTHPAMRRYFMLIPEAVQLVLHAATLGGRGSIYALEMGEQIRVLDMARNLIRLSGFVPDEEIAIVFTGSRPGEKLEEALVGADESADASPVRGVLAIRPARLPRPDAFRLRVGDLEEFADMGDAKRVVTTLAELLPGFPAANGAQ